MYHMGKQVLAHGLIVERNEMASSPPLGAPGGSDGKDAHRAGDPGLISGSGRPRKILGQEGPLEKAMAPHSSILAWRIPWTEEPGGLQSMGSQRVCHN